MNQQDLITALEQQAVVLTPNRRLAAYLTRIYHQHQHEKKKSAWMSPAITTLADWLQQQWQQLSELGSIDLPFLLNDQQALTCWQRIINNSDWCHDLIKSKATAETAYEAWKMLFNYKCSLDDTTFNYNTDSHAFFDWATQYQEENKLEQRCDTSSIPSLLLQYQQHLRLPNHIILACFDELTPIIKELFTVLQRKTNLQYYEVQLQSKVNVLACDDHETEYRLMACWAKEQLLQGHQPIGCVFPKLTQQRATIVRIFSEIIGDKNQFNISAGQTLTTFPMIHHVFNLLKLLNTDPLPLSLISQILRSPYCGYADTEKASRALFDSYLYQRGEAVISRQYLIAQSQSRVPYLHQQLIDSLAISYKTVAAPSEWANYFSHILASLGWPGEQGLSSEEYQIVQRWLILLNELAHCDHVITQCDLSAAISQLQQLASNTAFQIQSQHAPIQLLGILEAAGLNFDALWVMGLDDENWPAAAKPNPFIPLPLQRQYAMPHASAEREMNFSRQLTKRFATSAPDVIFSYSESDGDRLLRPSALIAAYPSITCDDLNLTLPIPIAEQYYSRRDVELYEDYVAPALDSDEKIRGGSDILKKQANCPFQAFATHRLGVSSQENLHLGLNALQRGVILHRTLELLWQTLKTHQQLCALSAEELTKTITQHVTETLAIFSEKFPHNLTQQFLQLEKNRLVDLINAWLQLEKQRPSFTVISQESEQMISLANMTLKLRIDRVDQLASGEKIIIDYKTSKTSINDWFDERCSEPQLLLYSLSDQEIAGLVFAQVRVDELCFKGLTSTTTGIPGTLTLSDIKNEAAAKDWPTQQDTWREQLTQLAQQFAAGYAVVDPKDKEQTCAKCHLKSLCRINSY